MFNFDFYHLRIASIYLNQNIKLVELIIRNRFMKLDAEKFESDGILNSVVKKFTYTSLHVNIWSQRKLFAWTQRKRIFAI